MERGIAPRRRYQGKGHLSTPAFSWTPCFQVDTLLSGRCQHLRPSRWSIENGALVKRGLAKTFMAHQHPKNRRSHFHLETSSGLQSQGGVAVEAGAKIIAVNC